MLKCKMLIKTLKACRMSDVEQKRQLIVVVSSTECILKCQDLKLNEIKQEAVYAMEIMLYFVSAAFAAALLYDED